MVGYTILSLRFLAQPLVKEVEQRQPARRVATAGGR